MTAAPFGIPLYAQQITRFAVVDYGRILQALNANNNAYTELEKKTEQVKAELEKRQQEIKGIQARIEELQKTLSEAAADTPDAPWGADAGAQQARSRPPQSRAGNQKALEQELTRLQTDVLKKTDALKDYYQKKTAELEADHARITNNSANTETLNQINAQVALVAEAEGYTMVLDRATKGIVWYSRSVDITDKIIAALVARRKR
jgi:outer membrane protein